MRATGFSLTLGSLGLLLSLCCVSCSQKSEETKAQVNEPLLIQPNQAVGKLRAGTSMQEVVAALGEPDRHTANAYEYTRLGFAVMPGPDGLVRVVMCGDVTGISGPLVKRFTGRTKEAIGMNSTREEVVKAYGEPTSSEKLPGGTESMQYAPLGITFTLEGNKVYHMIVRLAGGQEPDRTVTLEPPPGTTQK